MTAHPTEPVPRSSPTLYDPTFRRFILNPLQKQCYYAIVLIPVRTPLQVKIKAWPKMSPKETVRRHRTRLANRSPKAPVFILKFLIGFLNRPDRFPNPRFHRNQNRLNLWRFGDSVDNPQPRPHTEPQLFTKFFLFRIGHAASARPVARRGQGAFWKPQHP